MKKTDDSVENSASNIKPLVVPNNIGPVLVWVEVEEFQAMEVTKYPLALLDIRGLTGWFALGGIYKRSGKASGSVGESFKNPNTKNFVKL